jgi:hypothetical protein
MSWVNFNPQKYSDFDFVRYWLYACCICQAAEVIALIYYFKYLIQRLHLRIFHNAMFVMLMVNSVLAVVFLTIFVRLLNVTKQDD